MSNNGNQGMSKLSTSALRPEEISLFELYQRQNSLSTQLWQHYLIVNASLVAVVVLVAAEFKASPGLSGYPMLWEIGVALILFWMIFTYGNLSALKSCQKILLAISHQIEFEFSSKTDLFVGSTRRVWDISIFHLGVDIFVFLVCAVVTLNISSTPA